MENEWKKDLWPEEPDTWWWFYGATSKRGLERGGIRLRMVRIVKTGNSITRVCDCQFMFKSDGGEGYWKQMSVPELPEW